MSARKGEVPELTITLPALPDSDADLSLTELDAVAGGAMCEGCEEDGLRYHIR